MIKTVTSTGPYAAIGDVISYSITVTNTGNQTLTGVSITDVGVGAILRGVGGVQIACAPAIPTTLVPGASVVCTAIHTVTQVDIDRGSYTNVAIGDSDQTAPGTDEETVPIEQHPALTVVKSVTLDRPVRLGRRRHHLLHHRHEHRQHDAHRGHDHRSARGVRDMHTGDPGDDRTRRLGRLPGEPHGHPGRPRRGQLHERRDRRLRPDCARHRRGTTPVTATPGLDVVKTVTSTGPYDSVGDVISYSITVTNTGNQTLTGVTVGEANPRTIGPCTPAIPATLALRAPPWSARRRTR